MRSYVAVAMLFAAACGKSDKTAGTGSSDPAAKPTAPQDRGNYRDLPNIDGLEVEIPPELDAKPMDLIPGFENRDKSFAFAVQRAKARDSQDIAALKEALKELPVSEWYDEVKLDDGWYVTFSAPHREVVMPTKDGEPVTSKIAGSEYALHMVRTIGGAQFKCTCILPKREGLDAVIKACKSLRAKAGASLDAPPPPPKPAVAPKMTAEGLVAEMPAWEIQSIPRGLWVSENGGPVRHFCRVDLAMMMVRMGKVREAAGKNLSAVKCETKGTTAVCTFKPEMEKSIPDAPAAWMFVADEDRPEQAVMVVVALGSTELPSELPPTTPCQRPSGD